jgi:hypothetical protein
MTRIGLYGGPLGQPINDDIENIDGSIRILREKCSTCPYRPNSSFNYQLKRIVEEIKNNPTVISQCHNTYPSDVEGAVCRGGYDAFFKDRIKGTPDFVDEPHSSYVVLPYP